MGALFHAGELEVQEGAGVLDEARRVGRIIGDSISEAAARFLARQRLAIASTADDRGRVWASPLTGPAGFLQTIDSRTLRVTGRPGDGDPLHSNLAAVAPAGLLVIDPRTRQRMRFNGRGHLTTDGLFLHVEQAYGNCPKYIQLREELPDGEAGGGIPATAPELNSGQRAWIQQADTLFIASRHLAAGADASHRGGRPGFVEVESARRLSLPDYPGNNMFNTLGNLVANPRAGWLFLDFEQGHALQLTGRAAVEPDRRLIFDIEECRETPRAMALRYRLLEFSPAHPP